MQEKIDKLYERLVSLETEVANLRSGYIILDDRYRKALASFRVLTLNAAEAAKRAARAAVLASDAAKQAAEAAKSAASDHVIVAAEAAAHSAAHSAEAAI